MYHWCTWNALGTRLAALTTSTNTAPSDQVDPPMFEGANDAALVVSQSRFVRENGKMVPGPAVLALLRPGPDGWQEELLLDPESNVIHKAKLFTFFGTNAPTSEQHTHGLLHADLPRQSVNTSSKCCQAYSGFW